MNQFQSIKSKYHCFKYVLIKFLSTLYHFFCLFLFKIIPEVPCYAAFHYVSFITHPLIWSES